MARERQSYEYVMDVALRATLKELGFKRKTYAAYIRETEDRVWIFELGAEPMIGAGFSDMAGVQVPELDRIFERYAPGGRVHHGVTRNPSHVTTELPVLMEIAAGHKYYTTGMGRASKNWSKEYEAAQSDPLMKYRHDKWWVLRAGLPTSDEGDDRWERYDRRMDEMILEFGHFLNDIWLQYALPWYQRCDDPLFVADWMETRDRGSRSYCSLAVLHHMGGDDRRAADYLHRCFDEASVTYDELYRELYREHHRSWLGRWWGDDGLSDEVIAERAQNWLTQGKRTAETAQKLAGGLGIVV